MRILNPANLITAGYLDLGPSYMKEQTLGELFFRLIIAGHLYCDNLASLKSTGTAN